MPLTLATSAMGTRFELVLAGADESTLRAAGEAAIADLHDLDARLSAFRTDSLLAHINRTAHLRPVPLDADLLAFFAIIDQVHHASGGALDPTVGPLMHALGFRGTPSDATELDRARDAVGWRHVALDHAAGNIALRIPGMQLDLGSVAKGFALDLVQHTLIDAGVTSALVHGGTSSVLAIGAPPGQDAWRIAINASADPQPDRAHIGPVVVALRDRSMSVSARHGRTVPGASDRTHILDPRTGAPAGPTGAALACAVAQGPWAGTVAEAWSTAMILTDPPAPDRDGRPGGLVGWLVRPADARPPCFASTDDSLFCPSELRRGMEPTHA